MRIKKKRLPIPFVHSNKKEKTTNYWQQLMYTYYTCSIQYLTLIILYTCLRLIKFQFHSRSTPKGQLNWFLYMMFMIETSTSLSQEVLTLCVNLSQVDQCRPLACIIDMRILNLPALSNSFQNPLPIKILTTYITVPVTHSNK